MRFVAWFNYTILCCFSTFSYYKLSRYKMSKIAKIVCVSSPDSFLFYMWLVYTFKTKKSNKWECKKYYTKPINQLQNKRRFLFDCICFMFVTSDPSTKWTDFVDSFFVWNLTLPDWSHFNLQSFFGMWLNFHFWHFHLNYFSTKLRSS